MIYSYLKDSAFTAVKRNARYVKDALYLLLLLLLLSLLLLLLLLLFIFTVYSVIK